MPASLRPLFVLLLAVSVTAALADDGASEPAEGGERQEDSQAPNSDAVGVAKAVGKMMAVMFGDVPAESLFAGDEGDDDDDSALNPLIGSPAPPFELASTDGETVRLADHRGKVVVLDFWATWCGPCVRAMPQIDALANEFAEDEVVVFGVNQGDPLEEIEAFLDERDLSIAHLLDKDSTVGDSFGCDSIPMTVVIDAEGVIQSIHTGFSSDLGETLSEDVAAVLEGETLFDAEAVAVARARVEEKLETNRNRMGPFAEGRLVEAGFLPLDGHAYFDGAGSNGGRRLGEASGVALILDDESIGWFGDGSDAPRLFRPAWRVVDEDDGPPSIGSFRLIEGVGDPQLLAAGVTTDDDYDTNALVVGLFDADGENVWQQSLPCVGDWGAVEIDAGDLDGDGADEFVALFEQYGVFDATGVERYCHIVAVYSADGELITRRWFDGQDGTGVYVVPGSGDAADEPPRVMINLRGGAAFLRLSPAGE
ncbi:MAG: TlpA disulfide reductase family protein [Planctomycetota bacterium]